jgi:hypothetical protein
MQEHLHFHRILPSALITRFDIDNGQPCIEALAIMKRIEHLHFNDRVP